MTQATITTPRSRRAVRALPVVSLVAGCALVVDTVTITVINRQFDPLDSILFLGGFIGWILTCALLAVDLSRAHRGAARVALAVGYFVLTGAVFGVISFTFDEMGRHTFSTSNRGLHGEWSFFSIGICLLLIATWSARRARLTHT